MLTIVLIISDFQFRPLPSAPDFFCSCLDVSCYIKLSCSKPNCLARPSPTAPMLPNPLFPVFCIQPVTGHPTITQSRASFLPFPHPPRIALPSLPSVSGLRGIFRSCHYHSLCLSLGCSGSQIPGAIATASKYFDVFWKRMINVGCQEWFQGCSA